MVSPIPRLGVLTMRSKARSSSGRLDQAQIGVGVADLRALEEPRPSDHRVGDLQQDEPLLEGAHLERGAHQDGDIAIAPALFPALDILGDQARFRLAIPDAANLDLLAAGRLGPQGLAQPPAVGRDQPGGGGEDVFGGAIVALQPDHPGAGKIALEAQDVVHLRAAPAIDRLIVVADAADILPPLGQQPQPEVLGDIGVLIFVDQQIAETLVIVGQHIRMLGEQGQVVQQQIAEIAGVEDAQPLLIHRIEGHAAIAGEMRAFGRRGLFRRPAPVFPVIDQAGQMLGRPALGVDVFGFEKLLDQALLIVGVDDGVAGLEPHQLGVPAQDLGGDGMEGAQPAQALGRRPDDVGDARAHLPRGLVGEGDGQELPGPSLAGGQDVGQAGGEDPGLAGAGAGQDQNRALGGFDRRALLRIEPLQIVRRAGGRVDAGQIGNAGRGKIGHEAAFGIRSEPKSNTPLARLGEIQRGQATGRGQGRVAAMGVDIENQAGEAEAPGLGASLENLPERRLQGQRGRMAGEGDGAFAQAPQGSSRLA